MCVSCYSYHGGASFEYAGDRTLEHLQQYVTKMTGPATVAMDVSSLASLYTHPVALLHTHSKDDRPVGGKKKKQQRED